MSIYTTNTTQQLHCTILLLHGGKSEGEVAHDGGVGGVLVEPEQNNNIIILSIIILLYI